MKRFTVNSTMIPNTFFDEVIFKLPEKALRTYLIIVRKTTGWGKEWDSISISQFKELTGIKDVRTIRSGINYLIKFGLIRKIEITGKPTKYSLKITEEKTQSLNHPPSQNVGGTQNAHPTPNATPSPALDEGAPPTSNAPHNRKLLKKEKEKVPKRKPVKLNLEKLPTGISIESAEAFIDHRKTIKKPLSQRAFDLSMKEAEKAIEIRITPDQAIDETILAGWQAINITWIKNRIENNETYQHSGTASTTQAKRFNATEATFGSDSHSHRSRNFSENDINIPVKMGQEHNHSKCIQLSDNGMGEWS